jgi:hypothetical protein
MAQIGEAQLRRGSTDGRLAARRPRPPVVRQRRPAADGMGPLGHEDLAWLDRAA